MKRLSPWILLTAVAGCLAVVGGGCKKSETPAEWKAVGTRVSMSELRDAFQSSPDKEIQAALSDTAINLHYGAYAKTLAALEKLANHPSSSAKQKQVANKVITQVKTLAAKSQPAPSN